MTLLLVTVAALLLIYFYFGTSAEADLAVNADRQMNSRMIGDKTPTF